MITPLWEKHIEPDPGDQAAQQDPDEQAHQKAPGDPDGAGGPIRQVETQVLIDGEPVTVTDADRQQPGETTTEAVARARQRVREDARQIRDDMWDEPHHDEPDQQITPR